MANFDLSITYPERSSRLGAFFRCIIPLYHVVLLPHFIVYYFFNIAAAFCMIGNLLVVLFSGKSSQGLLSFLVSTQRYLLFLVAKQLGYAKAYPPFGGAPDPTYPLSYTVTLPEKSSRLLVLAKLTLFPIYIMMIPHFIFAGLYGIVFGLSYYFGQWVVLITGKQSKGLFAFQVNFLRYIVGVQAYALGITDAYPPFSGKL